MSAGPSIRVMSTPALERSLTVAIEGLGAAIVRYGLALVLLWIGGMKFTAAEAMGIQPLIKTSPLLSWLNHVLSVQGVSNLLGVVEITTAVLICLYRLSARASLVGSVMAVVTFLTTITFLFSLPGWDVTLGGFPALSGSGQFILKDVVLLGAAVFTLGESLAASRAA